MRATQVEALKLNYWNDSGGQGGMQDISLYDWQREQWDALQEPIQGINVIQRAAPYVNEQGQIRIKLGSETNTFGCVYLDLGMDATLVEGREG
jgi:hypothetical protein